MTFLPNSQLHMEIAASNFEDRRNIINRYFEKIYRYPPHKRFPIICNVKYTCIKHFDKLSKINLFLVRIWPLHNFEHFENFHLHMELVTSNSKNSKIRMCIHGVKISFQISRRECVFESWNFWNLKLRRTSHTNGVQVTQTAYKSLKSIMPIDFNNENSTEISKRVESRYEIYRVSLEVDF